jgi:hypothetical protein
VAGTRRGPLRRCSPGRAPTTATAGESERQPAATVERLVIVMVCPSEPLRQAIRLLDIGVLPEAAMVVLDQH